MPLSLTVSEILVENRYPLVFGAPVRALLGHLTLSPALVLPTNTTLVLRPTFLEQASVSTWHETVLNNSETTTSMIEQFSG